MLTITFVDRNVTIPSAKDSRCSKGGYLLGGAGLHVEFVSFQLFHPALLTSRAHENICAAAPLFHLSLMLKLVHSDQ
jgi:hypothetical protein